MSIKSQLEAIKETIPDNVKLIAVSKFHPNSAIIEAYSAGHKQFGENKVQEMNLKSANLPNDIEWHLLGHLQTNKVKNVASFVNTIQSVDSWKLLKEINKYANKAQRVVNCLLQIHIAKENTKYGLSFESCRYLLDTQNWQMLNNIEIVGLMGMATNTDNEALIREEFRSLKSFFEEIKNTHFKNNPNFCEISMGMSHDYQIAIEEGATIIRIGTAIFGEREY